MELLLHLTSVKGTAIVARLLREDLGECGCDELGECGCDELGERSELWLGDAVQFYDADRESRDPLGLPIGGISLQLLDERRSIGGCLPISFSHRRRGAQAHLSVRLEKLDSSETARLRAWAEAYEHSVDYERQAEEYVAVPHMRARPSGLTRELVAVG
jgi:hypothetical protein